MWLLHLDETALGISGLTSRQWPVGTDFLQVEVLLKEHHRSVAVTDHASRVVGACSTN